MYTTEKRGKRLIPTLSSPLRFDHYNPPKRGMSRSLDEENSRVSFWSLVRWWDLRNWVVLLEIGVLGWTFLLFWLTHGFTIDTIPANRTTGHPSPVTYYQGIFFLWDIFLKKIKKSLIFLSPPLYVCLSPLYYNIIHTHTHTCMWKERVNARERGRERARERKRESEWQRDREKERRERERSRNTHTHKETHTYTHTHTRLMIVK
jgi:hypothetical protein